jgi:hypothetical protein
MTDTTPEIAQIVLEKLRLLTPGERVTKMANLSQAGRDLIRANIRRQNPEASEHKIRELFAIQVLGKDLALKFLQSSNS